VDETWGRSEIAPFGMELPTHFYSPGRAGCRTGALRRAPPAHDSVDLLDSQLGSVKVEPVEDRGIPVEKEAVGGIDFNKDMAYRYCDDNLLEAMDLVIGIEFDGAILVRTDR
jgi:hypothetical protein